MDILNALGFIVGVAGLAYALYQGSERKKLIKITRSQAWFLYSKANNMTGIAQTAESKYIERHAADLHNDVYALLSKSAAFGLEMFRETIRLIQISEPDFSFKTIDLWERQGKIDADHKRLFIELVIDDKNDFKASTSNTRESI